ncbi:hypothetical protein [Pseudobacillus badius]|uniref:hypothetical protein n=1 Tax=Bacillus badius TaxID=1455 RepID=UPI0007B0540D|nr:hypothetical protein [Bacillus badius]KZN98440.1 hypothetical protein A4244_08995 [Bacillus badius]MED0666095.1 hypothetical protein [Bacillus badius]OCS83141.1 hypothetical protein A6M11_09005 [Bacillus badius]OVE51517.1 hypothetical protein B1A98_10730 [Bacillus badius]TDW02754.1 hypothetical protein B0G66_10529 [Bacillus badius]
MIWDKLLRFQKKNSEAEAIVEVFFLDPSEDKWERENINEDQLDFSLESLKLIDEFIQHIISTEYYKRFVMTYSSRIGTYVGEVIRRKTGSLYDWYEYVDLILVLSEEELESHSRFYDVYTYQELLYSRKTKETLMPLYVAFQMIIQEPANYQSMYQYADEVIQKQKL